MRELTCCPSFLLVICGPWVRVAGAIFLDAPVVQPLGDYKWAEHSGDPDIQIHSIARFWKALAHGVTSLEKYYERLFAYPDRPTDFNRLYPYFREFPVESDYGPTTIFN